MQFKYLFFGIMIAYSQMTIGINSIIEDQARNLTQKLDKEWAYTAWGINTRAAAELESIGMSTSEIELLWCTERVNFYKLAAKIRCQKIQKFYKEPNKLNALKQSILETIFEIPRTASKTPPLEWPLTKK